MLIPYFFLCNKIPIIVMTRVKNIPTMEFWSWFPVEIIYAIID